MKRLCLFAGYDSKGIIHDYVVYYLKEMSSCADIYYMADNEFSSQEYEKIRPYVKYYNGYHHGRYDFGSWQELMNYIGMEKLSEYDELILANDSVFGPLYPMKEFFNKIESDKEWDICGIDRAYDNKIDAWYLSSYFMVFKKKIFLSDKFIDHFKNIPDKVDFDYAINSLEHPFMKKFYSDGFKVKCLIHSDKRLYHNWRYYINSGIPFLKKKIFDINMYIPCKTFFWENTLSKKTLYPISNIKKYLGMTKKERSIRGILSIKNIRLKRIRRLISRKVFLWNDGVCKNVMYKLLMVKDKDIMDEKVKSKDMIDEIKF